METIMRQVRDIDAADLRALEHVMGRRLRDDQEVIFHVAPVVDSASVGGAASGRLPPWCDVFEGLSESEIADVESVMLRRADLNRPSE